MEANRPMTGDIEKDIIFTHQVKAGKRIYYLDVRKTRKDEFYLSITESKKIAGSDFADGKVQFEKHKIFLYREDFSNFIDGLTKVMSYIHQHDSVPADAVKNSQSENPDKSSDLDFSIEF